MRWKLDDFSGIMYNMEYAVIQSGGKQYRVSLGDIIEVDKLPLEKNSDVVFEKVLLFRANGDIKIGKPYLSDVKVKGRVLEQKKGEKIRVSQFKAKVRHRRVMGFRASLTQIQITDIPGVKPQVSDKPKEKAVIKKAVEKKKKAV